MCNQFVNTATEYWSTLKGLLVPFPHGADEGDVAGLAVHHSPTRVNPQAGQLWKNVDDLVGLEVVDEDVGDPEVLDKLQVHGDVLRVGGVVGVQRVHVQAPLLYVQGGEN